MLQDTLSTIKEKVITENILTPDQLDRLIKLLSRYKKRDLLYPGVVMQALGTNRKGAYNLLEVIKKLGILELNYELYCHNCNQFEKGVYQTLSAIPEGIMCDKCDEELNISRSCIVIYRVMSEG